MTLQEMASGKPKSNVIYGSRNPAPPMPMPHVKAKGKLPIPPAGRGNGHRPKRTLQSMMPMRPPMRSMRPDADGDMD